MGCLTSGRAYVNKRRLYGPLLTVEYTAVVLCLARLDLEWANHAKNRSLVCGDDGFIGGVCGTKSSQEAALWPLRSGWS